ncbi:class I SAM-dependent methyltransferase [Rhodococcus rhodochrous]|uniref:Methyltransferase n=1 Tax=Rhodococcus rhodochrous KG-21 TaxID=1441923 RepID=A0A0M9WQG1_RHORH|nr:class I SAM-dependent methyltransferase [Rhodococcus rhodochrous]KOS57733.1 methyltransferase [Rhodococcus rhodochrous KG-21]
MSHTHEYLAANRANWDERAPLHARSPEYAVHRFEADPQFLSDVVRFDLPELGDIAGLRGVHLQCHIGTDTLSLERLGARMTGLDFSAASIEQARTLAETTKSTTQFVVADVYGATDVLPAGGFDLVYTGIGALCWLPRIDRWADTVATLLAPGGRLFLREAHPVLWALDDERTDALVLRYPYFEQPDPVSWNDPDTYVHTDRPLTRTVTHEWNHGLGEIVSALLDQGLRLERLVEHTSAPWQALPGQMRRHDDGEWHLTEGHTRLPLTYTLRAVKPAP